MIAPPDIFLSFNREDQARAKGGKGPQLYALPALLRMAGSLGNCRSLLPC